MTPDEYFQSKAPWGRLPLPKLEGAAQLRYLVHNYGNERLVRDDLHISESLLSAWMSGEIDVPYTALLAVYWGAPIGFENAFSSSHWTHSYNNFLREQAQKKVDRLESGIRELKVHLIAQEAIALADLLLEKTPAPMLEMLPNQVNVTKQSNRPRPMTKRRAQAER